MLRNNYTPIPRRSLREPATRFRRRPLARPNYLYEMAGPQQEEPVDPLAAGQPAGYVHQEVHASSEQDAIVQP